MKIPGNRWLAAGAIILPLLMTWLSTQIAYSNGNYPHVRPLAHVGMIAGVVAGVLLLVQVRFESRKTRGIVFAMYIPLIVIMSLLTGIFTACVNGDCV